MNSDSKHHRNADSTLPIIWFCTTFENNRSAIARDGKVYLPTATLPVRNLSFSFKGQVLSLLAIVSRHQSQQRTVTTNLHPRSWPFSPAPSPRNTFRPAASSRAHRHRTLSERCAAKLAAGLTNPSPSFVLFAPRRTPCASVAGGAPAAYSPDRVQCIGSRWPRDAGVDGVPSNSL